MDTPNPPQNLWEWLVGAASAAFTFSKTFPTWNSAHKVFVRKVESDGSTIYVRKDDFLRLERKMDEALSAHARCMSENDKWQRIAKDWMEHP